MYLRAGPYDAKSDRVPAEALHVPHLKNKAYLVMAHIVAACMITPYVVMAYVVMAYVVVAYVVMALYDYEPRIACLPRLFMCRTYKKFSVDASLVNAHACNSEHRHVRVHTCVCICVWTCACTHVYTCA